MLRGVKYIECNKEELIQDFHDYINYLDELKKTEELWREQLISSVPIEVKNTERVFCSRGCSATHWINGQCFTWESAERKSFQRIERRAEEEARKKPYCEQAYKELAERNKKDERLDYDWKHTKKYKDWKTDRKFPEDGESIWKSLKGM